MSEPLCDVCGKPGYIQGAPGAPYSGCWCPDHAPHPTPPLYTLAKAVLILLFLVAVAIKIWRKVAG